MSQALYVDREFPPNDSSLGPSLAATGLLTWRRPLQFPGVGATAANAGTTSAFGGFGPPLPSDVRPCPFAVDASLACALSALAERPLLVSGALCGRVEATAAQISACSNESDGDGRGVGGGDESFRSEDEPPCRTRREGGKSWEARRRSSSKETGAMAAAQAFAAASRSGMFSARLCVDGMWKEYVLDDYFPCLCGSGGGGGGGGLCLSRAHGPALWVSMLEKAYARAMGSYSTALNGCCLPAEDSAGDAGKGQVAIEAGGIEMAAASVVARPAEVLGVFTGAPVLQVKIGGRMRGVPREEEVMAAAACATTGVVEDPDERDQVAEELWGSIVS